MKIIGERILTEMKNMYRRAITLHDSKRQF